MSIFFCGYRLFCIIWQHLHALVDAIHKAAYRAKDTMNSEEDPDDIFTEIEQFYVRGADGSIFRVKSLANKLFYRIRILFGISGSFAFSINISVHLPINTILALCRCRVHGGSQDGCWFLAVRKLLFRRWTEEHVP